ncbi:MAG TPA: hypothetical protein VGP67_03350 [Gaiellales bacterium]|nr:hypothetical protein [Gaiellales bacterium]
MLVPIGRAWPRIRRIAGALVVVVSPSSTITWSWLAMSSSAVSSLIDRQTECIEVLDVVGADVDGGRSVQVSDPDLVDALVPAGLEFDLAGGVLEVAHDGGAVGNQQSDAPATLFGRECGHLTFYRVE